LLCLYSLFLHYSPACLSAHLSSLSVCPSSSSICLACLSVCLSVVSVCLSVCAQGDVEFLLWGGEREYSCVAGQHDPFFVFSHKTNHCCFPLDNCSFLLRKKGNETREVLSLQLRFLFFRVCGIGGGGGGERTAGLFFYSVVFRPAENYVLVF
ncbi:unnamed protein product, partial [Ectocarpus sp. 8 AP-2014]